MCAISLILRTCLDEKSGTPRGSPEGSWPRTPLTPMGANVNSFPNMHYVAHSSYWLLEQRAIWTLIDPISRANSQLSQLPSLCSRRHPPPFTITSCCSVILSNFGHIPKITVENKYKHLLGTEERIIISVIDIFFY